MQLINLNINKIIIHQVYPRDSDGGKVNPLQSHEYINFDQNAMTEFVSRVRDALGDGSKSVQMEIVNQDENGLPNLIDTMIDQDEETFAVSSYDIARKLTDAQNRRNIPGGIVVVFEGTQGAPAKKFLGIIKAEIYSAYEKSVNEQTREISLKFVEEVLLTPGTRLYKTAGFFEKAEYDESTTDLNDKWVVMISDYQIDKSDGKAAAQYFYSDFIGTGYPQSSARTTRQFYEASNTFIRSLDVTESKKSDLLNALTTYLKVDTSSTASSTEFATKYLDRGVQDLFTEHMINEGIPNNAFTKDIEHIKTKLKNRKLTFSKNVRISAPSEAFEELVTIETIDGDLDESGQQTEWTRVTIKDRITQQE